MMEAHARRLIPYLADAVPGWFQATMALYDAWGKPQEAAEYRSLLSASIDSAEPTPAVKP